MDRPLLPSLQHLAAVRIALTIHHEDIDDLCKKLVQSDLIYIAQRYYRIIKEQEHWTSERKTIGRNKLSKLLPKLLIKRVTNIFQPLVDETNLWFRDHFKIMKRVDQSQFPNILCWNWGGTIDRTVTAKKFVQNESIDRRLRFVMACIYFWENDILNFWLSMSEYDRQSIVLIDSSLTVLFWIQWLREGGASSWIQSVSERLRSHFLQPMISKRQEIGRVRLSSFFNALNNSDKVFVLDYLWPGHAHTHDLRLCYNLLDETEQAEIFHSTSKTKDVLWSYLHWPLQSQFCHVIEHLKSHLTLSCVHDTLCDIFYKKLFRGKQDFDYLQLFKDFWDATSEENQTMVRKMRDFIVLQAALSYDEKTHPLPLKKFLTEVYSYARKLPRKRRY